MDKKLLDAFSNLSLALQEISDSLNEINKSKETSGSSIVDALQSLDITTQLKSIDEGVKKLQVENKEIISNQKKILEHIKSKNAQSEIGDVSNTKQKQKIKDGVGMIVLIAGGVLAIGLALKLIGKVDFKSVIALAIILPLLALSFERVSKVKTNLKDLAISTIGLVMIAVAITASSWILQYVKPISALQLLTTVFIAGAFAALSFSINKLANGIKGVDAKNLWKLPLVLVAASAAITASSWILQFVKPVGFLQLITTVFIAGAFAALSFSLGKLANGVKAVDPKNLWKLPLVLVAASAAIMLSSHILQYVKPVGFLQLVTTILIAGVFVVLSYGLGKLAQSMDKISLKSVVLLPLVLIALSGAILGSSFLLSQVQVIPLGTLINIALQAIALTVVGATLGFTIFLMSKMGLKVPQVIEGSLSLVIIATALMASSLILSLGNYENYPTLGWTIGVGVSMLAFGISTAILGAIIMGSGGLGLGALALGGIGVLLIASTVVGTAAILSAGEYGNFPNLGWSLGVGTSLVAFGLSMGELGMFIGGTIGLGYLVLMAGAKGITLVANTIVETASILSTGNFSGGPTLAWAMGTGILMTTFGGVVLGLGAFVGGTLGLGYLALKAGSNAVKLIAQSIVDSSFILSKGKYTLGPTKDWAEGVGLAIGAFAPVFAILSSKGIIASIFGTKVTPEDMSNAIKTISRGIIDAGNIFGENKSAFNGTYPSSEWSTGVGEAIGAFAPVFAILSSRGILDKLLGIKVTPEDMSNAIRTIARGIIDAGNIFGENKSAFDGTYPKTEWSTGVGEAIGAFGPVFEWANNNKSWFGAGTDFLKDSIINVATSISDSSNIFAKGNYTTIPVGYVAGISDNIVDYMKLIDKLRGYDSDDVTLLGLITNSRSSDITRMADDYAKLATSIGKLSASIQSIDIDKISALKTLTGSIVLMSLMDSDQFKLMMDALEDKAKIFVDVIKDVEGSVSSTELSIKSSSNKSVGPSIQDVLDVMNRMDNRLGQIASTNNNISGYVNEIRSSSKATIKKK